MTITYETLLAKQTRYRQAFGRMLIRWREANRWSLYDPAAMGETKGFRPVPYGLWQLLERGAAGELQSVTFLALGELNQHAAVPLGDWDDITTTWTPTEFWACYCGLRPVPLQWRQP